MSLKRNFSSVFAAAAGAVIFAGAAAAQDTTTAAPKSDDKIEHHHRDGRGGDRKGARGEFGGRHGGFGRMGGGMFRDLNLTDAQKDQIKQIREANKGDKANFETIRTLMEAKRNGTITAEQQAQLKAFRDERQAKAKSVHEQIMNVLTAEQKAKLEQRHNDMKQRREEFKKNHQLRVQQKENGAVPAKPAN